MPIRFQQVSDHLFRGGKPSEEDLHMLRDIFGIKAIVSLDGEIGQDIRPMVNNLEMKHIIIPVGDPDDEKVMSFFQDNICDILKKHHNTYVHCRHGSDRTGMACALYRINEENWAPQKAYQEALQYNFGDKVDDYTRGKYSKVILGDADLNMLDDTIVSTMRDTFQQGNVPPAFSPQQSFAPEENTPYQGFDGNMPFSGLHQSEVNPLNDPGALSFTSGHPSTDSERKRELALMYLDTLPTQIPTSGVVNSPPQGLRGAGPVEPQFFVDLY